MAGQIDKAGPGAQESKIPVFTVRKKGSILKNIFLNGPPPPPPEAELQGECPEEEKVLIGRHPDCHIILDHPSISRFHLEICVRSSSQKLSVVDLSSVHGTWVSGNKIEPRIPVELSEGDIMRLGASTRAYELHWVPVSSAFDWDKPLPALLEEQEQNHQVENGAPAIDSFSFESRTSMIPSAPPMPQSFEYPVLSPEPSVWEKHKLRVGALEEMVTSRFPAMELSSSSPLGGQESKIPEAEASPTSPEPVRSEKRATSSLLSRRSKSVSLLRVHTGRSREKLGSPVFDAGNQDKNLVGFEQVSEEETLCKVLFSTSDGEDVDEETFLSDKENMTPGVPRCRSVPKGQMNLRRSMNTDVAFFEREDGYSLDRENRTPHAPRSIDQSYTTAEGSVNSGRLLVEGIRGSDTENMIPEVHHNNHVKRKKQMNLQGSLDIDSAEGEKEDGFFSDKENCTPQISQELGQVCEGAASNVNSGRPGEEDICLPVEENMTYKQSHTHVQHKSQIASQRASNVDPNVDEKEDGFSSDKENRTPQVSQSTRQAYEEETQSNLKSVGQGTETHVSERKKKITVSGDQTSRDQSSNRQKIERDIMKRRVERIPFQSLFESSRVKNSPLAGGIPLQSLNEATNKSSVSGANISPVNGKQICRLPFHQVDEKSVSQGSDNPAILSTTSSRLDTHPQKSVPRSTDISVPAEKERRRVAERKVWYIVADTSCFLGEETRKSLQLLEGLRGTSLIIPRMVIRELDCLRRRESYFRKTSKASSALQWIEECMVKTSWWIHVQNSMESTPVPPTPPASPGVLENSEIQQFVSDPMRFSTCGSLAEILSPTAEDHILDCALLFKKVKNDGQLVLLTNQVSLKIKAMAEGLLCESPEDFRQSLVDPSSQRFLWTDSSPRGPTWSRAGQMSDNSSSYTGFPATKKASKAADGAKGLKLILLHNSHYSRPSSFIK